jgi:hypothetical protein
MKQSRQQLVVFTVAKTIAPAASQQSASIPLLSFIAGTTPAYLSRGLATIHPCFAQQTAQQSHQNLKKNDLRTDEASGFRVSGVQQKPLHQMYSVNVLQQQSAPHQQGPTVQVAQAIQELAAGLRQPLQTRLCDVQYGDAGKALPAP